MRELFKKEKGPFHKWPYDQKRTFVLALLQTLSFEDRMKMVCTSLTIDLKEYRILAVRPDTKPAEAVCVDFCMTHLFAHPHFGQEKAAVFFDASESFQKYLNDTWTRAKSSIPIRSSDGRCATGETIRSPLP